MNDRQNVKSKRLQAIYMLVCGLPLCGLQVICNERQQADNEKKMCVYRKYISKESIMKNIYLWKTFQL